MFGFIDVPSGWRRCKKTQYIPVNLGLDQSEYSRLRSLYLPLHEKGTISQESSFPVIHKIGNVDMFVLLKFENKMDREIIDFNFNSKHCDKYFALKMIRWLTVSS